MRAYDVDTAGVGDGALQISRVFGEPNLTRWNSLEPFGPWRGAEHQARLSPEQVRAIVNGLRNADFEAPPPAGAWLRSDDFYWAVSACLEGRFHFNAWRRSDGDLAALPFFGPLLGHDGTGIPVNRPRALSLGPFDDDLHSRRLTDLDFPNQRFQVQVGGQGLRLGPRLL